MLLALLLVMDHSPFLTNSQHKVTELLCLLEEQEQELGKACLAWDESSPGAVSSTECSQPLLGVWPMRNDCPRLRPLLFPGRG